MQFAAVECDAGREQKAVVRVGQDSRRCRPVLSGSIRELQVSLLSSRKNGAAGKIF